MTGFVDVLPVVSTSHSKTVEIGTKTVMGSELGMKQSWMEWIKATSVRTMTLF